MSPPSLPTHCRTPFSARIENPMPNLRGRDSGANRRPVAARVTSCTTAAGQACRPVAASGAPNIVTRQSDGTPETSTSKSDPAPGPAPGRDNLWRQLHLDRADQDRARRRLGGHSARRGRLRLGSDDRLAPAARPPLPPSSSPRPPPTRSHAAYRPPCHDGEGAAPNAAQRRRRCCRSIRPDPNSFVIRSDPETSTAA